MAIAVPATIPLWIIVSAAELEARKTEGCTLARLRPSVSTLIHSYNYNNNNNSYNSCRGV